MDDTSGGGRVLIGRWITVCSLADVEGSDFPPTRLISIEMLSTYHVRYRMVVDK